MVFAFLYTFAIFGTILDRRLRVWEAWERV